METKIPLYVISAHQSKIMNDQGGVTIKNKTTIGYELEDLTTYSTDGEEIEEKDQKDYDSIFVARLCTIKPVYKIRDFLDFHYRDCEDKKLFLDHMEWEVLPLLKTTRVSPPKGSIAYVYKDKLDAQYRPYAEVFEKWIQLKNKEGIDIEIRKDLTAYYTKTTNSEMTTDLIAEIGKGGSNNRLAAITIAASEMLDLVYIYDGQGKSFYKALKFVTRGKGTYQGWKKECDKFMRIQKGHYINPRSQKQLDEVYEKLIKLNQP